MKLNRIVLSLCFVLALGLVSARGEHLVILTMNDTHSHVDTDFDGKGGMLRQKVLFDSVLCAEKNVMRVHAGDAVQGTLYFSEFKGVVEYEMLNKMNFDVVIAGNHEYDNGMDDLAHYYKNVKASRLCSNYDFAGTVLEGVFEPYIIREFGGRKIGFIGLNLDPNGMIVDTNSKGVGFTSIVDAANAVAGMLKREKGVDFVVAVTHIGYDMSSAELVGDVQMVQNSTDIDLVIGGHTHTKIEAKNNTKVAWLVPNKDGKLIPITQTGNHGKAVGIIDIDLETLKVVDYRLLPIDKRYDSRINYPEIESFLAPYKHVVDSLMNREVAVSAKAMSRGLGALSNWTSDAARDITAKLSGMKVDCAIMNKGGIRRSMPKGSVSEGVINSMYPFDNRLMVIELTGVQLLRSLEIMAMRGGDATSSDLIVEFTKDGKIKSAKIKGKDVKPKKKYKVVTLDYLANGGDYMAPFKEGKRLFADDVKVSERYLDFIENLTLEGKMIDADDELRMKQVSE
ncbi:MAG: bifunctional metallophosphatase/5'-nucleotidase [Bacteroidales bacterium]|nr:bifunctional metallophosphatase/5'-nucleotidase [Bacteroidales bacterium]